MPPDLQGSRPRSPAIAALHLGADAVQMGTRFVASNESSAHLAFKEKVIATNEGDTILTLKELTPVRLIKNPFYELIQEAYNKGADKEELLEILGRGRAKKGMFEGNLIDGELEIGQIAGILDDILPASEIVTQILNEFNAAKAAQNTAKFQF